MPQVSLPECADCPPEIQEIYSAFQRKMGIPMVPNVMRVLCHSTSVARGTWGMLENVLAGGSLPRTLKEMMMVAISVDRGCKYCEAAHSTCCRLLGIDSTTLDKLVHRIQDFTPARSRDILLFGLKCARDPQRLTESDYATLTRHGLNQAEIMEIIAMAGLAVYINILVDATGIPVDDAFSLAS